LKLTPQASQASMPMALAMEQGAFYARVPGHCVTAAGIRNRQSQYTRGTDITGSHPAGERRIVGACLEEGMRRQRTGHSPFNEIRRRWQ